MSSCVFGVAYAAETSSLAFWVKALAWYCSCPTPKT